MQWKQVSHYFCPEQSGKSSQRRPLLKEDQITAETKAGLDPCRKLFIILRTIRPELGQGLGLAWREGMQQNCLGEQVKIQISKPCPKTHI